MGIFDRMGRLISSNVNSLLDRAEDPKKSVDLMVDDMKRAVKGAGQEVVLALASEKQLSKKVDELDAEADKWTKRAELALEAGDEALAREALMQKRRVVAERDRTEALRVEQSGAVLRMKAEVSRMEARQKELEARKGTIAVRAQQAKAGGVEGLGSSGKPNAFQEFRRMEEQIDRAEVEATARNEVEDALDPGKARGGMSRDELEARFATLERGGGVGGADSEGAGASSEVDQELALLKKKIRVK
jgi:phage shock protein A